MFVVFNFNALIFMRLFGILLSCVREVRTGTEDFLYTTSILLTCVGFVTSTINRERFMLQRK